jgi:alpha-beta hydrolase superfamily lysophospholipase
MAFFFKIFAESGYECIGMDQRGFGVSEGERGYIDSADDIYNDQFLLIYKAVQQY